MDAGSHQLLVCWQTLQHIIPFSRAPKTALYKFSEKIRCCVSHVVEFLSPTSLSPKVFVCGVLTFPNRHFPASPRPRVPKSPPTFSRSLAPDSLFTFSSQWWKWSHALVETSTVILPLVRKKHSIETAVVYLVDHILEHMDKQQSTGAAFIDLKSLWSCWPPMPPS